MEEKGRLAGMDRAKTISMGIVRKRHFKRFEKGLLIKYGGTTHEQRKFNLRENLSEAGTLC